MLNKYQNSLLAISLFVSSAGVFAQDSMSLSTLFTTAQERQIIDNNRYKKENKQIKKQGVTETVSTRELEIEKVNRRYKISGISINMDGSRTAWLNNKAYENGAIMDDGSKLRINNGAIKSVSITTPDGKKHTATSGETLVVSYARAQEQ